MGPQHLLAAPTASGEKRARLGEPIPTAQPTSTQQQQQYMAVIDMQHQILMTHMAMLQRQVSDLQQAVADLPAAVADEQQRRVGA